MACDELPEKVSTHSRLKAAGLVRNLAAVVFDVSTHSRLKAAGGLFQKHGTSVYRFNTQPPEGGWNCNELTARLPCSFQHTAA